MMIRAKKGLGQHFLKDKSIAQRIVDSLSGNNMPVLEVGPGMGVLTDLLLQRSDINIYAVEIDSESIAYLKQHFPDLQARLIQGDFLQMDLHTLFPCPFAVIGNFPYHISSQIFFKILDNRDLIPEITGMVQKEVAERIACPPGSKTYGILSVLLQAFYNIEYLFTVHEHVFVPPPKVKSGVIRLTRNEVRSLECDEALFRSVVKTTFNQRRKTIRNSLKPLLGDKILPEHSLLSKRPEQLSVAEFVELTEMVAINRSS
ncbi:MAG: 16S rRNA (adenine(1518)-N(6)/adenine(1519)-N(6))-dimethyltransferase RsmA [Bacteroidales bacterium]|nr:16S rRNA (adenine(1518)-N(6)/adenine(1519)-N(6))-dimethyltransferase RsmA [Bacteroidales bacterium]MCL2132892.1 16S rRNA (adenine(1518)-N(6)/adenine(1519)-N(6))-dimethyltransferase RsmA [Bacteroidales bacterium]